MEFVANTFAISIPSFASRSMFGVRFTRDPYALIACAAWSSDMMTTMFGRWARCCSDAGERGEGAGARATADRIRAMGAMVLARMERQDAARPPARQITRRP